jgi:hypothetical protein
MINHDPSIAPQIFYDIDIQRLIKILGYYNEFIDFSLYGKMGGNPEVIYWRTRV